MLTNLSELRSRLSPSGNPEREDGNTRNEYHRPTQHDGSRLAYIGYPGDKKKQPEHHHHAPQYSQLSSPVDVGPTNDSANFAL